MVSAVRQLLPMNNGNLMDIRLTVTNGGLFYIDFPMEQDFYWLSNRAHILVFLHLTKLKSLFQDVLWVKTNPFCVWAKLRDFVFLISLILYFWFLWFSIYDDFVNLADSNVPRRVLLTKYCRVTCEKNTSNGNKQAIDICIE